MTEDSKIGGDIIVNKFTEDSAKDFRRRVLQKASLDPNLPITVYIDSYGGYLDSLNSMLETMEQVPNPIVTVCMGKAMSCGAALLAAGEHRYCGRQSRIMVHQGSSGTGGPIESLQNDVNESKRINKQLMAMLAKRCGKSIAEFKKEMKDRLHKDDDEARDMFLDAKNALEIGIIDHIGMPLVRPLIMYTIEVAPEKEYEKSKASSLDEVLIDVGLKKKTRTRRKTKAKTKKKTRSKK